MSLHAFLRIKTSPPCLSKRCLVVFRRLVTGLHRDDVNWGAGDGTRTRDSLLGRQELYQLSYARIIKASLNEEIFFRSGCADLNRGPHGPKPCALPTAPHPATALHLP